MSRRIIIEQQFAQIGLRVTPAKMQIVHPHREMSIENDPSQLNVDWESPSVEIDWTDVRNETGLKTPEALTVTFRDDSRAAAYTNISNIVKEAQFVGSPEKKGPRIAEVEKKKTLESDEPRDVNIAALPKSRLKTEWNTGYLNVSWSRHNIKIEWTGEYMPSMKLESPHSIEIYLRDKPYIRITVVEDDEPMFDEEETGHALNETA